MMRQIWAKDMKLNWNDPILENNKRDWITFFEESLEIDMYSRDCEAT